MHGKTTIKTVYEHYSILQSVTNRLIIIPQDKTRDLILSSIKLTLTIPTRYSTPYATSQFNNYSTVQDS
jgi:hypothetical protein